MISTFNGIDDGHWSPLYSSARGEVIIIILIIIIVILIIIIIITRIQLGMECVRGPRKFQLIITTVTRILGEMMMMVMMMMIVASKVGESDYILSSAMLVVFVVLITLMRFLPDCDK